jgi:hypothetical protein
MSTPRHLGRIAALGLFATLVVACGSKDKKSSSKPAPQAATTSVKSTDYSPDRSSVKVAYASSIAGAHFKCALDAGGTSAEWADCPADGLSVTLQPGVTYLLRVKGIGADGTEAAVTSVMLQGGSQPAPAPGGSDTAASGDGPFATLIVNKGDVSTGATVGQQVKLDFDAEGGSAPADLRYDCKRESDTAFKRCNGDTSYVFDRLEDGHVYSLAVRAVSRSTGAIAAEDSVSFTAAAGRLTVTNAEALSGAVKGSVTLGLVPSEISGLTLACRMDGQNSFACSSPLPPLVLDTMAPGRHTLAITGKDASGAIVRAASLDFCAIACDSGTGGIGGVPPQPAVTNFQIGSFYGYTVPAGMHVTEYATNKTVNTQHVFLRVLDDDFYVGNDGCYRDTDRKVALTSPAGQPFLYCSHTYPNEDWYKVRTGYRLANNHLEIATDPAAVTPVRNERTLINVFDADYEYMQDRSRFEQLCANRRGTITRTPPIPFTQGFWGLPVLAQFYMCVADLVGAGPGGIPAGSQKWWVGAFFMASSGQALPQYECFTHAPWTEQVNGAPFTHNYDATACGAFHNPSLLEVTYMTTTPYMVPEDFARAAQQAFVLNLRELTPILH